MNDVRIPISDALADLVAKEAIRTRRTMNKVTERAIGLILDAEEAASMAALDHRAAGDGFIGALLSIVVEHPFVVAIYDGRVAGVGVDIRESGKMSERTNPAVGKRAPQVWAEKLQGGPLLLDWAPWFRGLCHHSGLELRS